MTTLNNKKYLLLCLGLCLAILPLLLWRDFTPDNELRYLSIADEAIRNHTFFAFTNHGVPYADKPPLYLWGVMLMRWLLGGHYMWALCLLSLVPALLITIIMDRWTAPLMHQRQSAAARMLLLTGGLFLGLAFTVRMDMLMSLFIVLAMRSFWRIYSADSSLRREQWLFPVYLFMALFTKGPLGVLIPLCSILVFLGWNRQWRAILQAWGWRTWMVLLAGCAVWFGLVFAEGGWSYLDNLLFHQTVGRAVNAFHHNRPFYYYLICIWYCLAPWALLIIGSWVASLRAKVTSGSMHQLFLAVSITTLVLLSCISGKLQVYMLPAIPFMVYAAALSLEQIGERLWCRLSIAVPLVIVAFSLPALIVAGQMMHDAMLQSPYLYAAAASFTLGAVLALVALWHDRSDGICKAVQRMGTGMLVGLFCAGFALPQANATLGYGRLCEEARALTEECGIHSYSAWKVKNAQDMDVYLGVPVTVIDAECDNPIPHIQQPTLLILRAKDADKVPAARRIAVGKFVIVAVGGTE